MGAVVLLLGAVFWLTASLGKTLVAIVPVPFLPLLWRAELGFAAGLFVWWRSSASWLSPDTFWTGAALACGWEAVLTAIWVLRRRAGVDVQQTVQFLSRLR